MFGGDKDFLLPYKTEAFDLKGEIISCSDHHVEFYIINPYTNVRKFFTGTINAGTLDLKYYLEDNPQQVFEDVFEYVGKGEGK